MDGPQFFIKDDPRLLRVGQQLRRFQIDELPRFVNVLLGMSLDGRGPARTARTSSASVRCAAQPPPGITGPGRSGTRPDTDREWIRYDLEYVQRRGGWTWIIAMTIRKVLFNG